LTPFLRQVTNATASHYSLFLPTNRLGLTASSHATNGDDIPAGSSFGHDSTRNVASFLKVL